MLRQCVDRYRVSRVGQLVTLCNLGQHQQVAQAAVGKNVEYRAFGIQHAARAVFREYFHPDPEEQYPAEKSIKLPFQQEPVY